MKILIISGFLGAGKTTFIKELAKRTGRDFAVMENEYGAVDIDGAVLKKEAEETDVGLRIWEMTEGCICCTMKSDFASSILTIANTIDPEYLVVEPTGVGMLSRILENIKKIEYERITVLKPVTLVDGSCFAKTLRAFPEILKDQLSYADTILITKREHAPEEALSELAAEIRKQNAAADICTTHYTEQDDEWWNALLKSPRAEHEGRRGADEAEREAEHLGLTGVSLKSGNELLLFLNGVVSGVFGDIYRAKGYLRAGEAWLRFDVVAGRYCVSESEPMTDQRAVFIGKELRKNLLREALLNDFYACADERLFKSPRRKSAGTMTSGKARMKKMQLTK